MWDTCHITFTAVPSPAIFVLIPLPVIRSAKMDKAGTPVTDESVGAPLPSVSMAAATNNAVLPRDCFPPSVSLVSSPSKRLRSQSLTDGDVSTHKIVPPPIQSPMADSSPPPSHHELSASAVSETYVHVIDIEDPPLSPPLIQTSSIATERIDTIEQAAVEVF